MIGDSDMADPDTDDHPSPPPARALDDLLKRLAGAIEEAEGMLRRLEGPADPGTREEEAAAVARGLARRLDAAEQDRRELALRLVEADRRTERLMTLYVATYHLHSHQDPREVESAIAEIAVDLLGASRFVLLLRDRDRFRVSLTRPEGVAPEEIDPLFAGGEYRGGEPLMDAALADGSLRLAGDEPAAQRGRVLAAVPLNVEQEVYGMLVILDLLEQKRGLTLDDRDLLDLLAAHAASALLAARLFQVKDRRTRTFESLLELARGDGPEPFPGLGGEAEGEEPDGEPDREG